MSYFKQVFILIFSLVFLYWWSNNHLHKDRKNKEYFLIEDVHYHSKPLHKVDSLLFFESNSKAEVEILNYIASTNTDGLFRNIFLSKLLNLSDDKNFIDSIYSLIHNDTINTHLLITLEKTKYDLDERKDFDSLLKLKTFLASKEVTSYYKGKVAYLIARIFDERKNNLDSAWVYLMKSKEAFEKLAVITPAHVLTIEKIIDFCTYKRKNLLAIRYSNYLFELDKYYPKADDKDLANAYAIRSFMLFREGDLKGTEKDIVNGLDLINPAKEYKIFQMLTRSKLVNNMILGNDSICKDAIEKLKNNIALYNEDYIDINRWQGQYLNFKGKYKDAIPFLENVLKLEEQKGLIYSAKYFTTCFLLSQCYEKSGEFEKALLFMAKNLRKPLYDKDDILQTIKIQNTYSFVPGLRCAQIYYSKFLKTKSIEDLQNCKLYLDAIETIIFEQFGVIEENAILQFYQESGNDYFELGLEVCFELWEKDKNIENLQHFINYSERNKNSILLRDRALAHQQTGLSKEIITKELFLRSEIKKEQLKGLSDNTNFNRIMDEYENIETTIYDANKIFYKKGLIKQKQDPLKIQQMLSSKQTVLCIDETNQHLFFSIINNKNVLVERIVIPHNIPELMDSLIYVLKSSNSQKGTSFVKDILPQTILKSLTDTIVFIPDGIFHKLPFEKLVNSNISKVVYVPSYHLINDFLPKKGATGKAVFFAFSDPATIKSKKRTRMIELPGTYREVVKLKNQYPDSRLYSGNNATKNNFLKEYQNPDNHYIHLALHGVAVSDTKDDIKLYFRTKPGGLDSLYGYELLNLNSSCKKIVLSACHSGAGKYIKGEGLFSLPRYFMINGANDVSFNFWEVED